MLKKSKKIQKNQLKKGIFQTNKINFKWNIKLQRRYNRLTNSPLVKRLKLDFAWKKYEWYLAVRRNWRVRVTNFRTLKILYITLKQESIELLRQLKNKVAWTLEAKSKLKESKINYSKPYFQILESTIFKMQSKNYFQLKRCAKSVQNERARSNYINMLQ